MALQTFALPGATGTQTNEDATAGAAPQYRPGWCGVHVIQYQKNEGPSGNPCGTTEYRLTISLKDSIQDPVGGATLLCAPGGEFVGIDSQLPYVFESEVGGGDSEPIFFKYGGQAWNSNDAQCSVGGYANGARNMDCGFNC